MIQLCSAFILHSLSLLPLARYELSYPIGASQVFESHVERVKSATTPVDQYRYSRTTAGVFDDTLMIATIDDSRSRNILTNRFMEGIRKASQADYDNKYSDDAIDQAVKADDNSKLVLLLVPIVSIKSDLQIINDLISQPTYARLSQAQALLNNNKYETKQLKKTFNRYADNIYYSDPDRANLYLGGGAVPDTKQTEKYLLRNEVITAINNLHDDMNGLLNTGNSAGSAQDGIALDDQDYIDTVDDCRAALESIQQYLSLVDTDDLELALKLIAKPR